MEQNNQNQNVGNSIQEGVAANISNKKTKRGTFIAGIIFFVLVLVMFVVTCCLKGYIMGLASDATTPEQGIGVGVAFVVFIVISPFILFPLLAFFITSVVLLTISIKSCVKKIQISSVVCLCVDVAIFVITVVLIFVWIIV